MCGINTKQGESELLECRAHFTLCTSVVGWTAVRISSQFDPVTFINLLILKEGVDIKVFSYEPKRGCIDRVSSLRSRNPPARNSLRLLEAPAPSHLRPNQVIFFPKWSLWAAHPWPRTLRLWNPRFVPQEGISWARLFLFRFWALANILLLFLLPSNWEPEINVT